MNSDELIHKYLNDKLSKSESAYLKSWVMKDPKHLKIFKEHIRSHSFIIPLYFDTEKAFENFHEKIQLKKTKQRRRMQIIYFAASFAILIVSGVFYLSLEKITNTPKASKIEANESIKNIQITLSDGSKQLIDKKMTTSLKTKFGQVIANKNNNVLTFGNAKTASEDTTITQIDIPYGEKFKIKLSDGTLVWLNSGTSFKFPQQFGTASKTREVEVIGEAYFEVAKNKQKPFIVSTSTVNIKVVGTHFNVSSYANDIKSKTTLMEGEVYVYKGSQKINPLKLRPNQQAVFQKDNKSIERNNVKASDFNSWIKNILLVDDLSFLELKKKLERRYNVTIINEIENLWDNRYRGEFQDESLTEILKTIALSSHFDFEVDGKQVRIFKKE